MPAAPKARGEVAEARFVARALSLGFTVLRPFGDSNPYDFVVGFGEKLSRVQVKSAWKAQRKRNKLGCFYFFNGTIERTRRHRAYTAEEIDFIAAHIAPLDLWYIIPREVLGAGGSFSIWINPRNPYAKFRDRWDLLC